MVKNDRKEDEKPKSLKILAAGDLHGSSDIAKKLAEKAKKNNVDLVLLLGDIHGALKESKNLIAPFKKAGQKVLFVPGNWDTTEESNSIRDIYDIKNIDGYYTIHNDVGIIGIGNPDFQLSLNAGHIKKIKNNFEKLSHKNIRKSILASHLHAQGTTAEFSGFPGSSHLRKAIDEFKPDFFISAHIHEAEGIEEKIGKTKVINVGRKGKILEI